ncbi:HAL/PAL/TAL family ammonia-lyase [Ferrimonas senticii]|uniref:HAL/PAL/TAL family ammonia-lyase n=1 Tax=Ferrimonas senticii TaxID=394566 RepID=UPI000401179B|nr:aromatic amino acid ammonia-lyase [Ferrimonas senticii]
MNCISKIAVAVAGLLASNYSLAADAIELNGKNITPEQIVAIGYQGEQVSLSKAGVERMERGHQVLLASAAQGMGVYGLTVGVGWNKDQPVFGKDGKMSPELRGKSELFNRDLTYTHTAAIGPYVSDDIVRMAMAIRLNQLMTGHIGIQPAVAQMYVDFLNHDIVPRVPARGSVGTADILPSAHIALAMMGEWDVTYKGKVMPAADAMKQAGLTPVKLYAKDALSIFSNSSMAVAYAVDVANKTEHLLEAAPKVVAMSLEALNGNVSPYLAQTVELRPMPYVAEVSADITAQLDGSYLWQVDDKRALQDPLAFRGSQWSLASAWDELHDLKSMINTHLNSSDDNPAIVLNSKDARQTYADAPQVQKYFVDGEYSGAVFSASNFEPVQLAVKMQGLSIALGHVSRDSVFRTLKLADPAFTHLTRFMNAPENHGHGFGAIQKTFVNLFAESKALIDPVSLEGVAVAGYIEDTFTHMMLVGQRMDTVLDNLSYMYGLEMMHSAQGIDIRMRDEKRGIGAGTLEVHQNFRKQVPFVAQDRPFTKDIEAAKQYIDQL